MTANEAKVALRLNSLVKVKTGGSQDDFAFAEVTAVAAVHHRGQKMTVRIECEDFSSNAVYYAAPEDLTIADWGASDEIVQKLLSIEMEKEKTERILKV